MAQDVAIEVLLWEYREMRQEVREMLASTNTTLNTALLAITGVCGWGLTGKNQIVLCVVPTMIFAFCALHLVKTMSMNVLGAYCQIIAEKIKKKVGKDDIVMDWEGGSLWENLSQPTSALQCGLYLFFFATLVLFLALSWLAFSYYRWTLIIHVIELAIVVVYAVITQKWNHRNTRREIVEKCSGSFRRAGATKGSIPEVNSAAGQVGEAGSYHDIRTN